MLSTNRDQQVGIPSPRIHQELTTLQTADCKKSTRAKEEVKSKSSNYKKIGNFLINVDKFLAEG